MYLTEQETLKFISKTTFTANCHIWNGRLDKDGYGIVFFRRKNRRAHRVAWFSKNGDIEEGLVVNHICRNRACINPEHLQAITASENSMRDTKGIGFLNSLKTHCINGHLFDRKYGKQRYCSICQAEKTKRLRKKWNDEDTLNI